MKIAICDDDLQELLLIASLLEEYKTNVTEELSIVTFLSGLELLTALQDEPYNLILLDVMMPGLNGMQTAKEIRTINETVKIIFLTSSPEFAVDSYRVRALNYLLKPATREQLYPILNELSEESHQPKTVLSIRTRTRLFALPYNQIEYLEVMSKTLSFHLADGRQEEISGNLNDYESALLAQPGFIKTHRSYLVNLRWVMNVKQWELTTFSGQNVPISRRSYQQVCKAYMEQLFLEKGVK